MSAKVWSCVVKGSGLRLPVRFCVVFVVVATAFVFLDWFLGCKGLLIT